MSKEKRWQRLASDYRQREMIQLADWIVAGESGVVLGLPGVGRATLLGYLCHHPDVLTSYLPRDLQVRLLSLDLHNLPDDGLATFYRVILRAFHENLEQFDEARQQVITTIFRRCEMAATDAFLPQTGLRELLRLLEAEDVRVVLVLNRFDRFLQSATVQMTRTLRGLRDAFKGTLCYLMGMGQEAVFLSGVESAAPLRTLLDMHVFWVPPLGRRDGLDMIWRRMPPGREMPAFAANHLLSLTGGFPSLLRIACTWWLSGATNDSETYTWRDRLLSLPPTQHRLQAIWRSLTQEEQHHLSELAAGIVTQPPDPRLQEKGVCRQTDGTWQVAGELLAAFVANSPTTGRGKVWRHANTESIYQGAKRVEDLAPLEQAVLTYLLARPYVPHSHDDLITNSWSEVDNADGVSTEAVYQVVRRIRLKIEPDPAHPMYLVTRRGGYQFFPEGRPDGAGDNVI